MSARKNPPLPARPFALLLAEGGDEIAVCRVLAGSAAADLCCWTRRAETS